MIQDCQQLAIDNNWALERINTCHIGNTNEEMGIFAEDLSKIAYEQKVMAFKLDCVLGVFGAIGLCILGILIKRYFMSK